MLLRLTDDSMAATSGFRMMDQMSDARRSLEEDKRKKGCTKKALWNNNKSLI